VGIGNFTPHKISGCGDPRGGPVAIYLTISECQKVLYALNLHSIPYDANYVEGLYSDYTCSDDDSYLEAKGTIGRSSGSSSVGSALTGSGYIVDSDMEIDYGVYVVEDEIYPLTCGKIEGTLQPPSDMHCMMASRGDASGSNGDHGGRTASG
jgi:hypothetical protein